MTFITKVNPVWIWYTIPLGMLRFFVRTIHMLTDAGIKQYHFQLTRYSPRPNATTRWENTKCQTSRNSAPVWPTLYTEQCAQYTVRTARYKYPTTLITLSQSQREVLYCISGNEAASRIHCPVQSRTYTNMIISCWLRYRSLLHFPITVSSFDFMHTAFGVWLWTLNYSK